MKSLRFFQQTRLILAGLTLAISGLANGLVTLPLNSSQSNFALAQSGGRARGGSFDRPSSPQQAPSGGSGGYGGGYRGGYSAPYDYPAPYNYPSQRDYYPNYRRPSVIVVPTQSYPAPGAGYGTSSSGDGMILLVVLACGVFVLPVLFNYMRQAGGRSYSSSSSELDNDRVTVTRVRVGLLSQARYIQDELTQLSLQAKLDTQTGLAALLQETVLALLRAPENWSHAQVSSQTVNSRQQASQVFEQLSIQSRSKLSAETLVNTGGQVRRQTIQINKEAEPASYIVVTMLVGTADDQPLAQAVHSTEELAAVLKRLGSVSPNYLLVYEVIWTPQDASDSLSHDQMLMHYPDLIQIA